MIFTVYSMWLKIAGNIDPVGNGTTNEPRDMEVRPLDGDLATQSNGAE